MMIQSKHETYLKKHLFINAPLYSKQVLECKKKSRGVAKPLELFHRHYSWNRFEKGNRLCHYPQLPPYMAHVH